MPIVREPSQRRAWVKWNYGQNNASKTSLQSSCTEIIHLGGSRVGSPEDDYNLRPATSQSVRSGHSAETGVTPEPVIREEEPVVQDDVDDRPLTGWFETDYSSATARQPNEPHQGIARSCTAPVQPSYAPMHAYTTLSANPPAVRESMASQVTQFTPAPLNVPLDKVPSPMISMHSSSSSHSSKAPSPPLSAGSGYTTMSAAATREPAKQLRRTQSAADIQQRARVKSKALPPRPLGEDEYYSESGSPVSSVRHVGQLLREEPADDRMTQWFPLPPLTAPPPSKPLPAINGGSRNAGRMSPDDIGPVTVERALTAVRAVATSRISARPAAKKPQSSSKHSPQERLWLHRNYRGEATFLKAWGLSIENPEEREEGLALVRELMSSEEDRRQVKKAEKAKELGLPDGGLQIIIEEEKGTMSEPDRPSPRMVDTTGVTAMAMSTTLDRNGQPKRLRVPPRTQPSPKERHLRSESESSVLGAYLDIRMSRMD